MQGQGYGHGSKYSDEEDYFSTSDSDLSVSDEGESHPHEPPTAEEERECHKGKSVIDIRDDSDVSVPRKIHRVDLDLVEKKSKRSSEEEPAPHVEEDGGCRLDAAEKKEGTKRERPMLMWKILEEENERWIDANETKDTELDNVGGEMDEYAGDPPYLLIPLLKFQKEWLAWALKQEESEMRGGILADETGMGKTIQAIALVLTKQAMTLTLASRPFLLLSYSVMPETECTLVICPEVALMQWKNDMEKIAEKGIIRVLVYHGPKRKKKLYQFFENDFVLTTYSILSAEYRKVMPTKKKMKSSGLEAVTSQYKKQDEQEAEPKENPAGSHHGAASRNSVLHSVKWTRIILDEAHYIKNKHRSAAKAVFALESSYKWALSGTALQVGELYSLVRFLQLTPYSYLFCTECDCKSLEYSSKRKCNCVHSTSHFLWWKRYISQPILASEDNVNQKRSCRRAMILLKHKILKSIALRRTKKGRAADIYNSLPQKIVQLRQDIFDIDEKNYYQSLYNISRLQFYQYVADKSVLNNFMHIIQLLTRIRQVADHPYIDIYSQAVCNLDINERTCDICLDVAEDPVVTSCQHVFCKDCFIYYSEALGEDSCPKQNKKASMKRTERSSFPSRIPLKELKPSTKMLALRDEINKMIQRDKSAKGVVLSQFTSFLELIGYFLFNSGIHYVPHVGQMTLATSNSAIETFNRGDSKIFLVSFKAGAAVLKLIKASHVFLMDPWWNPTQELQAVDLIRRIGQKEQVRVISFIIKDTIEEKILMLQEINQLVFEGNPGGSPKDMGRLTENELTYLFLL